MANRKTKAEKEALKANALEDLRTLLTPGMRVAYTVTHVSSSGMSRNVKLMVIDARQAPAQIRNVSGQFSDVLDAPWQDDGSVRLGGVGLDVGAHAVMRVSRLLHPDGGKDAWGSGETRDRAYVIGYDHV